MNPEPLTQKYARLSKNNAGVSGVGWLDNLQQAVQFETMLAIELPPNATVLDVGCGVGDLLTVLDSQGFTGAYTGIDLLPAFINQARATFKERSHTQFLAGDINTLRFHQVDFVFASGLFDYKLGNSPSHFRKTVQRLISLARLAAVWNGYYQLPPNRPDMWAVQLSTVADVCRQHAPFWQLRADYASGHYTAFAFNRAYYITPALQTLIGHLFLNESLLATLKNQPQLLAHKYGLTIQQLNLLAPLITA